MKDLLKRYKETNSVLEKATIWTHIEGLVDELSIEHNPDEYSGSLYYDEDCAHNIVIEREAYKRGFMQAIHVLEFE